MFEKIEKDGKIFYRFPLLNKRSSVNPRLRVQRKAKLVALKDDAAALAYHNRRVTEVALEIGRKEAGGYTWQELFERWDVALRAHPNPRWCEMTRDDHYARLSNYTKSMFKKAVKDLVPGDVSEVLTLAEAEGCSVKLRTAILQSIDIVFKWGMSNRFVVGHERSICQDICAGLTKSEGEKLPLILRLDEIRAFLDRASSKRHQWFPIWFFAIYTGMRCGEINALRKDKIEMVSSEEAIKLDLAPSHVMKNYGKICVERAWKKPLGKNGPTKGRMWRTVPINSKLYWFLHEHLKIAHYGDDADGERVFEKIADWDNSRAANVLRDFCQEEGLKEITFHTLRACFATQMAAAGVARESIKKIGGWKESKTLEIYIRSSGIDEAGKTEVLDFGRTAPGIEETAAFGNVINLFKK